MDCLYRAPIHRAGYDAPVLYCWCLHYWDQAPAGCPSNECPAYTSHCSTRRAVSKATRVTRGQIMAYVARQGGVRTIDIARVIGYKGHNLRERHLDVMAARGQIEHGDNGWVRAQ